MSSTIGIQHEQINEIACQHTSFFYTKSLYSVLTLTAVHDILANKLCILVAGVVAEIVTSYTYY